MNNDIKTNLPSWELETPILLVFFVREDTFSKVFESVRNARPKTLLLWQDGARNEIDVSGIEACRRIAENIDWECQVYRSYHDINMGCDPSTYLAFKWAFSLVDRCIILEDDQVPSQSFFRFCEELLKRYKDDERISHICGYNIFGEANWCNSDYLFSYTGSGAWASWRRVADTWDDKYSFIHDKQAIHDMRNHYGKRSELWVKNARRHASSGKEYWESIIGIGSALQSRYAIIPRVNLVQNYGISQNATHSSVSDLRLIGKEDRALYLNTAKCINFPLIHPKYVISDHQYAELLDKRNNPSIIKRISRNLERVFNMVRYGEGIALMNMIMHKMGGYSKELAIIPINIYHHINNVFFQYREW